MHSVTPMHTIPSSQAAPILWPDDIKKSGYLFGWRTPVVCVCGVLDAETVSGSERSMNYTLMTPRSVVGPG